MQRPLRTRRHLSLALAFLAVGSAGCQDYNFNPVGNCLIQPGQRRVTLENISTADVLFVVDDSGSMGGEQDKLAANFAAFVSNLNQTNRDRVAVGLDPIDFHLAITTSSVFINGETNGATCKASCGGAAGTVCCDAANVPLRTPKTCTATSECATGNTCSATCPGLLGENICCGAGGVEQVAVACTAVGAECGRLEKHYRFDGRCQPGVATAGGLYPHGAFVGAGTNPRVLHFDKELYPKPGDPPNPACPGGTCNRQGYTAVELEEWFKQNVRVGTCGSGQEQALQAARLAVQKALAGQQLDMRRDGSTFPAEWPHENSKLVLVFLGDEDDCSSPEDPVAGVILSGSPGADACVADATRPGGSKQFPVSSLVNYFAGLGRPLGAGFIASTLTESCADDQCQPGSCCDTQCTGNGTCRSDVCGGQGPGFRLIGTDGAAPLLRQASADVVVGSMCDPQFSTILNRIADVVKPPSALLLPTQPAGSEITVVRIAAADGATRKTCRGPAPASLTAADAEAQDYDWWFTASREQITADQRKPTAASRFVYINHATRACEANPGETYSADYLGRLPSGGCVSREECYTAFGRRALRPGEPEAWTCYAGEATGGGFVQPTAAAPGTCVCGDLGLGSF